MALLRPDSSWERETSKTNYHGSGDPLAIIYNEGMWRLNRVSPLYNFRYLPVKMKAYVSKVRQVIVRSVPASSAKYTVTFEELPNLKYSEEDSSGLLITVSITLDSNPKPKTSYVAVLLSWGISEAIDKATHLPYMLERGEQRIGTAVKSALQALFDCNITPCNFTQHELLQFGFNLLDSGISRSVDPFTLVCTTPNAEEKDRLNLSFEVGDVNIIWNGIKDETMKKSELVNLAYQILQNQIFHSIMLDINVLDLCEVKLTKAEIKSNGIVKMKTPETVNSVFTVLNEITNVCCEKEINTS